MDNRPDIRATIEQSGVILKKSGNGLYKACCPFHDEKTPSFTVFEKTQSWYCFGSCGVGGNVYNFIQKLHGCSYREAMQLLNTKKAIKQVVYTPPGTPKESSHFEWWRVNQYRDHPDKYRLWQTYRPLSETTIDEASLGVGVLPWDKEQVIRLIMPVFKKIDTELKCVMLRGRRIDGKQDRKWLTNGSPVRLYGMSFLPDEPQHRDVIICNNMADSRMLAQFYPERIFLAIAGGENSWQLQWGKVVAELLEPAKVGILLDHDTTGRNGALKIYQSLMRYGIPADSIYIHKWPADTPDKMDAGEAFMHSLKLRA